MGVCRTPRARGVAATSPRTIQLAAVSVCRTPRAGADASLSSVRQLVFVFGSRQKTTRAPALAYGSAILSIVLAVPSVAPHGRSSAVVSGGMA